MSLARSTVGNLFAQGFTILIALVTIPIYLKVIGPVGYGWLALAFVTLNYASLLDLGTGKAAAFHIARAGREGNRDAVDIVNGGFSFVLTTSVVVAVLAMVVAVACYQGNILAVREIKFHALLWIIVAIPFVAAVSYNTGVFQGYLSFPRLNLLIAVGGAMQQIFPLVLCWLISPRLDLAMAGLCLAKVLHATLMTLARPGPSRVRGHRRLARWASVKQLLSFGVWAAALSLLAALLTTGDRFLLTVLEGNAALAAYTIPSDLAYRLLIVAGSVSSIAFPAFAASADPSAQGRRVLSLLTALMTPISVAMIFGFRPFLLFWLGPEIAMMSSMLGEIIVCGVWISAITGVVQSRLMAEGRARTIVWIYAIQIPPYFLLSWFAIDMFGVIGAAVVWSLRSLFDLALQLSALGQVRNQIQGSGRFGAVVLLSLALVAMGPNLWVHTAGGVMMVTASLYLARSHIALLINRLADSKGSANV